MLGGKEKLTFELPGENALSMQSMAQPKDEDEVQTAPCLGRRKMLKYGRACLPVPVMVEPGNRIGESTIRCQEVPKKSLKIKIHQHIKGF
ncbi:MAG: hypothetical protein CMI24_01140 [Opitutae bacterium]|nr:hypothetical protein [Opitutae bacterium]